MTSPSPRRHRQGDRAGLGARGEWTTNDKTLLDWAGLRHADEVLAGLTPGPEASLRAVDAALDAIEEAVVIPGAHG